MELMHNPVERFQITTVSLPAKEQPTWPYAILSQPRSIMAYLL
jgi:hypothetical protein